jgi:Tfp pilus assembly protein PilN
MPNSSFLPEDYLERKAQQRTNIFSLVMFVLVMGAVIAAFLVTNRQRTAVKALQSQVNSRFETAAKRLEQLDELQQRKEQMVQKARVTSSLLERVPRTLIFSELINNMPNNVSLLEADLETKVVQKQARALTSLEKARDEKKAKAAKKANPLPEVKETAVTMSLIGVAPTDVQVAQFMAALSRSPLFADLNLAYSQEERVGDETMRRFRVEMGINQAIDLQKLQPAMVRRPGSRDPMGKTIVIDTAGKLSKPAPALPVSDPGAKPAAPR